MALRYRKIYPRFWKDERVIHLSTEERLVALEVITHQSNRVGIFAYSPALGAEATGLDPEAFRRAFEAVCASLGWRYDDRARVLWIPTWWRFNRPQNPEHFRSCLQDLEDLAETSLMGEYRQHVEDLTKFGWKNHCPVETFRRGVENWASEVAGSGSSEAPRDSEGGAVCPTCSPTTPPTSGGTSPGTSPATSPPTSRPIGAGAEAGAGAGKNPNPDPAPPAARPASGKRLARRGMDALNFGIRTLRQLQGRGSDHRDRKVTDDRRKKIRAAVKTFGEEDTFLALRNLVLSPHHRGENDRDTEYLEVDYALRKVEHYADLCRGGEEDFRERLRRALARGSGKAGEGESPARIEAASRVTHADIKERARRQAEEHGSGWPGGGVDGDGEAGEGTEDAGGGGGVDPGGGDPEDGDPDGGDAPDAGGGAGAAGGAP